MTEEPLSPEELAKQADTAFTRSEGNVLFGTILEPFTIERQVAATLMGMRFGFVDQDDIVTIRQEVKAKGKKTQVVEAKLYRQVFRDLVLVLWLCSVKSSEAFKAQRKPEEAERKAFTWANKHNINLGSEPYNEALRVFFEIMTDIQNSKSVPVPRDESEGDDDEPPGE